MGVMRCRNRKPGLATDTAIGGPGVADVAGANAKQPHHRAKKPQKVYSYTESGKNGVMGKGRRRQALWCP